MTADLTKDAQPKKRILLVDDHPDIIDVVSMELEVLGYDVTVAKDGLEAVAKATAEPPDLIVMDILMPKMDGLQASAQIRQHPKTRTVPILAATALWRDQDRADCLASGCDDHIAKPFTYRELGVHIHRLLRDA